jgi:ATP-dependent protease Clp ATPase subunit
MVGQTGTGKTLSKTTKMLDVPLAIVDATYLPKQVMYVVKMSKVLTRLLQKQLIMMPKRKEESCLLMK